MTGFLADHQYDLAGVPESELEGLFGPEVDAAGQRIAEHCGF